MKHKGKKLLALLVAAAVTLTTVPLAAVAASSGTTDTYNGIPDNFEKEYAEEIFESKDGEEMGLFTIGEDSGIMTAATSSSLKKAHFYVVWENVLNDGANGSGFTILGGAQWVNTYPKTVVMLDANGNETNNWSAGYCLNYGLDLPGLEQTETKYLTDAQRVIIGDILSMGYQHTGGRNIDQNNRYKWLITQIYIWAACVGTIQYNPKTGVNELTGRNGVKTADEFLKQVGSLADYVGGGNYMNFYTYAGQVLYNVLTLRRRPDFCYATAAEAKKNPVTLEMDEKTGTYRGFGYFSNEKIQYDPNGLQFWNYGLKDNNFSKQYITQNYDLLNSGIDGLSVKYRADSTIMSGGKYGVEFNTTDKYNDAMVSKKLSRTIKGGKNSCLVFTDGNANTQNIAMFLSANDTIDAYYAVRNTENPTAPGEMYLYKESEDGIISGVQFGVSGSDGSYRVFTTDSDGKIDLSSLPAYEKEPVLDENGDPVIDEETGEAVTKRGEIILYTAQELNVPDRYVTPPPQSFTMSEDEGISYTGAEALQAAYATLAVLNGTSDPIKLYDDNAEFTQVSVKENGTAYIKVQNSQGQKLGICYAFCVTNGGQIYYGYTDENGIFAMRDFDISSKNNGVELVGYFQNGSFVATDSYRGEGQTATLNFNFDGEYFTPYEG